VPLDPDMAAVLRLVSAQPPMHRTPIPQLRARRAQLDLRGLPTAAQVEDIEVPGPGGALRARLYRPARMPAPMIVFFHGGGFVFGSMDSHYDGFCRALCGEAGCVVLSLDYRLAPEHPFPAATEDCRDAVRWAAAQAARLGADPARILVAGGSAGGNLAAVTALRLRDEGGPALVGQVLIYPVTDFHTPPTDSYLAFAEGHHLTRADMVWFWAQYLSDPGDCAHPYAAPLRAPDLTGLPPAFVLTAEYDPLCDEGEAYAERLAAFGVPVAHRREAGMIHGFLAFPTPRTSEVIRGVAAWIRSLVFQLDHEHTDK
jgi:acetyl esterase